MSLARETRFAWRDRTLRWTLLAVLVLSGYAVATGLHQVAEQNSAVTELATLMDEERSYAHEANATDSGGAAYYAYHLTYWPLSDLAFSALGRRDDLPWQHKLKALAIEGQIYENDTGHPELASAGRLDFAFLIAVLLPLFVIIALFDLEASERRDARRELLIASGPTGHTLFRTRAIVRGGLLFVAAVVPFVIGAGISGTGVIGIGTGLLAAAFSVTVWVVLARLVTRTGVDASTSAMTLIGLWLLLALVIPQVGKLAVERIVAVPQGGEILLVQREAVNDAWDLPKAATMEPFLERYPEWRDHAEVTKPFDWKWYYAFQQVGDQTAEPLSQALRNGRARRDDLMGWLSLLSPPLLVERVLTRAAGTDVRQHQRYLGCVREFHAQLRHFFYPYLFGTKAFSLASLEQLPTYAPCSD